MLKIIKIVFKNIDFVKFLIHEKIINPQLGPERLRLKIDGVLKGKTDGIIMLITLPSILESLVR